MEPQLAELDVQIEDTLDFSGEIGPDDGLQRWLAGAHTICSLVPKMHLPNIKEVTCREGSVPSIDYYGGQLTTLSTNSRYIPPGYQTVHYHRRCLPIMTDPAITPTRFYFHTDQAITEELEKSDWQFGETVIVPDHWFKDGLPEHVISYSQSNLRSVKSARSAIN